MKLNLITWGLFLTAGFFISYILFIGHYEMAWVWAAWGAVLPAGNFILSKKGKKHSQNRTWVMLGIFGFITTIIIAFEVIVINYAFLMTVWMLLIGSENLSQGLERKNSNQVSYSLVILFASIYTLAFGNSYFLSGALFLGLLTLLRGICE